MATYKLFASATGKEIFAGQRALTFRGEWVTVTGYPTDGRNRVWVKDEKGGEHEYFPQVIKAEIREV